MDRILDILERGGAVVTVNTRLARRIRRLFDRRMETRGVSLWPTPRVLPLGAWVRTIWEESWPEKPLMGAPRAAALWENITSKDPAIRDTGISPFELAGLASEAYGLMAEYGVELPGDIYLTEEAAAFKRWTAAYRRTLDEKGYVDRAGVAEEVVRLVRSGEAPVPAEALFTGFDEQSPLVTGLIRALEERGTKVELRDGADGAEKEPRVTVRAYPTEAEEARAAAVWAREAASPGKKVGVVVPRLERYRDLVERVFSEELDPASVLPWNDRKKVFNISLGRPLSEEPIVGSALEVVKTASPVLDTEKLSALLSPYLFGASERLEFSAIEAAMRERNRTRVTLEELARRTDEAGLDALSARMRAWSAVLRQDTGRHPPAEWAHRFTSLLKGLGWPGPVGLSSREFQTMRAWNELLEEFSTLGEVTGPVTRARAAEKLARMAREKVFQPESPECPVEVVGALESAGLAFDHLWLMGCHEYALPREPSPNPFIPLDVQKKHGLPRSSAEKELRFAERLAARLIKSAPSVEVSYPREVDGREVKASPLFRGYPVAEGTTGESVSLAGTIASEKGLLEDMPPEADIPLEEEELASIKGGTFVLKDFSACPFRAFALHRLGARGVPEVEPGMSPLERGKATHRALKDLWTELRGSARLAELHESGLLKDLVRKSSQGVLRSVKLDPPFSDRYMDMEAERLETLLMEWLGIELSRPEFTVKALEEDIEITLEGLALSGRVDRVDTSHEETLLLFDYKTGEAASGDWVGERPRDPQLPLYALALGNDAEVSAVAFAGLKPGKCGFKGVSRDGSFPGTTAPGSKGSGSFKEFEDWSSVMEAWRRTAEKLARGFVAGVNTVDPARWGSATACDRCDVTPLCRVFETGGRKAQEEDDE